MIHARSVFNTDDSFLNSNVFEIDVDWNGNVVLKILYNRRRKTTTYKVFRLRDKSEMCKIIHVLQAAVEMKNTQTRA